MEELDCAARVVSTQRAVYVGEGFSTLLARERESVGTTNEYIYWTIPDCTERPLTVL